MDRVTQTTAASAEEMAAACQQLTAQAASLDEVGEAMQELVGAHSRSDRASDPAQKAASRSANVELPARVLPLDAGAPEARSSVDPVDEVAEVRRPVRSQATGARSSAANGTNGHASGDHRGNGRSDANDGNLDRFFRG